jgi:hypothetical protein
MTNTRLNAVLRRQRRALVKDAVYAVTVSATVASSFAALGQFLR